ncbi:MAG: hypothetical protein AAGU19_15265 [Prolixibacteraceae bacterium]
MKKIIVPGILLLLAVGVFAQKVRKEVVYLKNGSVIKGQVVPVDEQKTVVHADRNTWVFSNSEIDTIVVKKLPVSPPGVAVVNTEPGIKNFFFKAAAGVLASSSDNNKATPFSFDASCNVRLISGFYAGLGGGIDFLEETYLPAFLNLEYHFRKSRVTPFIGFQGGYAFPADNEVDIRNGYYNDIPIYWSSTWYPQPAIQTLDNKGGLMFTPSFGMITHINRNLGWSLSFGYRFQEVIFEGENKYELETTYNRFSVKIGIIFN